MNIINEYKINNREKSECNFFFQLNTPKSKSKEIKPIYKQITTRELTLQLLKK